MGTEQDTLLHLYKHKESYYKEYVALLDNIISRAEKLKKRAVEHEGEEYEYYSLNDELHNVSEKFKFTSFQLGNVCNLIRMHLGKGEP